MATKKKPLPRAPVAPTPLTESEQRQRAIALAERQIKITRRLIAAKKSKDDLIEFTKFTMPDPEDLDDPQLSRYKPARHHEILAAALQEVEAGRILRLAVSMFPQSGKSEICSRRFSAWYIGRNPEKNLMFGTYSQDFSEKFGYQVRGIIDKPNYRQVFPKVSLAEGSKSRAQMTVNEYGGSLLFLGRGGMGSGNPASIFLIDDPIKDAKEAQSATIRDDVWDWYTHVVEARCNVFSAQIIVQTRWSEDDLIGRLTDPNNPHYHPLVAAQWKVINIPAVINDEELATIMGKKVGDALWPERFPLETLAVKQALDPVAYSALYMGRPTPPEGVFFKADDLFTYTPEQAPKNFRPYMSGDLALGDKKSNDHSCVGQWMLDEHDNLYLSPDLYWDRKKADASVERIIDMMLSHKPMDTWWEKGQIDKAVGPFLIKRAMERKCYHSITALPVAGDKGFRASAVRGRMRMGKVFFPKFAPWWPRAKEQLLKFTGSGDDMEDDFCLTAFTRITMEDGSRKFIRDVLVGDRVATPDGAKSVLVSRSTGINPVLTAFISGTHVTGTANHPVWDQKTLSFVRLENLCQESQPLLLSVSSTVGETIGCIRRVATHISENISKLRVAADFFIATFGRMQLGPFLMGMRSIIAMETPRTMSLRTWNACPEESINGATSSSGWQIRKTARSKKSTSPEFKHSQQTGTNRQRGGRGTVRTLLNGSVLRVARERSAEETFNLTVEGGVYFANDVLVHNCDMISIIGQALGKQLRADSGTGGNVVKFPKVGTLGWIKHAHNVEERERKKLERGGF